MKKFILLTIFTIAFVTSCVTTKNPSPSSQNPDESAYAKVKWNKAEALSNLEGKWVGEDFTIIYPYKIGTTDYFLIRYNETDDSYKWLAYANGTNITIENAWNKRFAAIPYIYHEDYPLADANGIQKGVKVRRPTSVQFVSNVEILIPEATIMKNLDIFSWADTKDYSLLKLDGTFRYFSSVFQNQSYNFTILEKAE